LTKKTVLINILFNDDNSFEKYPKIDCICSCSFNNIKILTYKNYNFYSLTIVKKKIIFELGNEFNKLWGKNK
jgi:hypothetical protein